MDKKFVINCKTGEKKYIKLTLEEEAQRLISETKAQQDKQEEEAKRTEDKKIKDELKVIAIERLKARGAWV